MSTIKSTDSTFDTLVKENKIIIFDFWDTWCAPCLQIAPVLEEISNEMKEIKIAKHQLSDNPNVPTRFMVKGIPTMILMKDGNHVSTLVGAQPKQQIVDWIKSNI